MRFGGARLALALATLGVASCGSVVASDPVPPPLPTDFQPGPALGAPDTVGSEADGRDYLIALGQALQPRWASFLEDLRTRLSPSHELNASGLESVLLLSLNQDGVLVEVKLETASGAGDFDAAAMEVARDAQPYPAPPPGLASDDGRFRFRWLFARDRRQAGPATAGVVIQRWPLAKAIPELIAGKRYKQALARMKGEQGDITVHVDRVATAVLVSGLESRSLVALAGVSGSRFEATVKQVFASANSKELIEASIAALGRTVTKASDIAIMTGDDDAFIARAAAKALAARGQGDLAVPSIALRLSKSSSRWSALAVLGEVPAASAVGGLTKLATGRDRALRLAAIRGLGVSARASGATSSARGPLIKLLKDRDARVREAACAALADSAAGGSPRRRLAYWAVIELVRDRDRSVRGACARAAASLEPRMFAKELYRLGKDQSPPVQLGLASSLGAVPGLPALGRLTRLASAKEASVRAAAARSLAQRSEPQARGTLAAMVSDGDADVRLAALGANASIPVLETALADTSPKVRRAAFSRLAKMSPADFAHRAAVLMHNAAPDERTALAAAWLGAR